MSDNQFIGALYTYPWDLVDEGLDTALDKIVDLTGCQGNPAHPELPRLQLFPAS